MNPTPFASLAVVTSVLLLCLVSRSVSNESSLGSFADSTVASTCTKILRESEFCRSVSRQDETPVVALIHNGEALSLAKSARKLAMDYNLPISTDLLDAIQDLQDEQDVILQNIAG
jgi:hypothetical protein